MLRERAETTDEKEDEISGRLTTPQGQEELRRTAIEWLGHEQNIEQPKLPPAPPEPPETYQVKISS